jgi:hypothetical protein
MTITFLATLLISTGCTYHTGHLFQSRADYFSTIAQRETRIEAAPQVRKGLGLALAGGGTKAADFSLGVIQGLAEADVMDQIDVMSTVSGGGYAALWYYTRMLDPELTPIKQNISLTGKHRILSFFQDCHPSRYINYLQSDNLPTTVCPAPYTQFDGQSNQALDPFRHQNYLRGYQDIFRAGTSESAFSFQTTREDAFQVGFDISLLTLRTLVAAGLNVIPNIVFDWETSLWDPAFAPSQTAYDDGIVRSFGARPPECKENQPHCIGQKNKDWHGQDDIPQNKYAWRGYGDEQWVRKNLTFDRLRNAYAKEQLPLWVINTTAGEDRIPFHFNGAKPFQQTAFEFSPFGSGSGLFGYSEKRFPDISPLEAAMSSAAFLDSQVKSIPPPIRNIATTIMKTSTLDWGRSYPNPAISPFHATVHRLLPFPLYFLDGRGGVDQINIRLSDGGQSENLGVYPLINRRATDIIISDHSFDRGGTMEDICHLKQGLAKDWSGRSLFVVFPGLSNLDSVCNTSNENPLGYDIFNWEHPILLGCITSDQHDTTCTQDTPSEENHFSRLYLIKPAFPGTHSQHHLSQAIAATGTVCRAGANNNKMCQTAVKKACANIEVGHPYRTPTTNGTPGDSPWEFEKVVNCELLTFMMWNAFVPEATNDTDKCPHFPQISTVAMTTNSSPWIYGALRELARYYARQLGWFFEKPEDGNAETAAITRERFRTVITYQNKHPIKPSRVMIGLLGPTVKAGEFRSCLGLEAS